MDRLFVFGIGGSGERVMRSLVMLLSGGMPMNCNVIQPVFIDSDKKSKALSRACEVISAYRNARRLYSSNTDVSWTIDPLVQKSSLFHVDILDPILLDIDGGIAKNLNAFINETELDKYPGVKAEYSHLYTNESRSMDLTYGFVGNPSIGAVVLNKMLKEAFKTNPNLNPTTDDGCFIINSIFGGTGAAGFPLLVNKLRDLFKGDITGLKIGGLTMFPYFNLGEVEDDGSVMEQELRKYDVDDAQFSTKSKASLSYYDKYVKCLSSLYFIGSGNMSWRSVYPKHKGGEEQDNPAHLLEVIGAKSVSHFTFNARPLDEQMQNNNFQGATTYYNYFVKEKPQDGRFFDLESIDADIEFRAIFVRMQLMYFVWEICVPKWIETPGNQWHTSIGMDKGKYDTMMGTYLRDYFDLYKKWVDELQSTCHSRGFQFHFFDAESAKHDSEADIRIGNYFFPKISHISRGRFSGDRVVDPKILGKMQGKANEHNRNGFSNDDMRYKFAFYTSLFAIEHIVMDKDNNQCINLAFNRQ